MAWLGLCWGGHAGWDRAGTEGLNKAQRTDWG